MPCTFSTVLSSQNSGAISMAPPIETAIRIAMVSTIELRSSLTWCFHMDGGPLLGRDDRGGGGTLGRRRRLGSLARHADRTPHVVGHDHRAGEEHQAPERADDVGDVLGCDGLDEGVR